MRTDGSFHGSFTLAPRPAAWSLMRPGATDEHGSFACGKLDARKNICANLRDLWETTKRPMRLKKQMGEFAHRSRGATQMPCGARGGVSTCFMCVMKEFTFFLWWI